MDLSLTPEVWGAVLTGVGGLVGGLSKVLSGDRAKRAEEHKTHAELMSGVVTSLTKRMDELTTDTRELRMDLGKTKSSLAVLTPAVRDMEERMVRVTPLLEKIGSFIDRQAEKLKAQELGGGAATRIKKTGSGPGDNQGR